MADAKPYKVSSSGSYYDDAPENVEYSFGRYLMKRALKIGSFVSVCYPYRFAYCLVKLGYVPNSIAQYKIVNKQRMLRIPSAKEYMNYMKTDEADKLWMRGEICYCSTYVLYDLVEAFMNTYLKEKEETAKSLSKEYLEGLYVTSVSVFVAVVVTQPFEMLSYRQIGQYVNKEEIYSSASGLMRVFGKPGIFHFLEGTIARYIYFVIPTVCGNLASRTWNCWLEGRIPWCSRPKRFLKFTEKGTGFEWLRPTIDWFIDNSVYYWVEVFLSPLEVAVITSNVWDSGISVGSAPFLPDGGFFRRFARMWSDGRLFRSTKFNKSTFTANLDSFVVL